MQRARETPESWLKDYARVMLVDLELAARLYFESEENPELLMQSLYHAQQAVEKACKLYRIFTGEIDEIHDPKKLREELKKRGHSPLLRTPF